MIDRLFFAHPRKVGESYGQHASIAASFGAKMVVAGAKCLVHAVIPAVFPTAASDQVRSLHRELDGRRQQALNQFPDYVI